MKKIVMDAYTLYLNNNLDGAAEKIKTVRKMFKGFDIKSDDFVKGFYSRVLKVEKAINKQIVSK